MKGTQGKCRACNADVWFLTNSKASTGKLNPVNVAESENANIVVDLEAGQYTIVKPGDGKHISHFVTCPAREQFRRK